MCVYLTGEEIDRWSKVFSWMDDDKSHTYFELTTEEPECMKNFSVMASKTYARGLILVTVYYGGNFYLVMEDGEGDQPLLVSPVKIWWATTDYALIVANGLLGLCRISASLM